MALEAFFTGSPFVVEVEKDLSLMRQLLDVIVLRKGPGAFPIENSDSWSLSSYGDLHDLDRFS